MATCLVASLMALSAAPAAQKDAFRDALIGFHRNLAGDEGNEGPEIVDRLDRMAVALDAWDRRNRTLADVLRELDAAIQRDSRRGSLHVQRGLVLEAMGRDADALAAFQRAWNLDREDAVSAYLLASRTPADATSPPVVELLKVLDRRFASLPPDRRVELFPEVALVPDRAAATPVFSPALYAEGFRLVMEGRYAEAIVHFRAAVARDPLVLGAPSEPHRMQAGAYADAGNDAKSIEELEAAVRLSPEDERSNVALGRALAHAGQVERAERVLLNIVAKVPQSADAHSALADLYESSNRGREALDELEVTASFTVLAGKGALYFRLADLEHRHLEYERVIEPLTRRVRLNPNDGRAHTDLGLAYSRVGRTDDALVELVMAAVLGPGDPEALSAIGQIHFDAGNYAAAEAVLRQAIAIAPTTIQARYLLGHTLARLGRARDSQEQLAEFDRLRAAANEDARRAFEIEMRRQEATRRGR
jgi:tetratricopeptide (TPR) repeat protein